MAKCAIVYIDGTVEMKQLNGLKDLQGAVGGLIEAVPVTQDTDAYINEEGKYMCDPNIFATFILQINKRLNAGDYVAGNLVLVGKPDEDGNDTDVPAWVEDLVASINKDEETIESTIKGLLK